MCGIGGILRVHPRGEVPPPEVAIPEAWLDIIDDAVKHRGPDGKGRFRDRVVRDDGSVVDVALVHRRLSIIDHRDGWQPMVQGGTALLKREDGPYLETPCHVCPRCSALAPQSASVGDWPVSGSPSLPIAAGKRESGSLLAVVFNGCIYNHLELRKELQKVGHVFATDHSDTEVLLHGWREWGPGSLIQEGNVPLRSESAFSRFHDMFAVATWDRMTGTITLARDPFGQKPLYHSSLGAGLWSFASTVPALARVLRAAGKSNTVPADRLHRWIRYGSCDLPPHSLISATPISATTRLGNTCEQEWYETDAYWGRYWRGPWGEVGFPRTGRLNADQIEAALIAAVHERFVADAPIGCFLSGGIDSSLITRFAHRLQGSVSSFSIRMPVPGFDETAHAVQVAKAIGTRHTVLDCSSDPANDVLTLIDLMGVPFGDSSLLPTHWVSRATRTYVTVALSGDGGDELFAGYDRYLAIRWLARVWPVLLPLYMSQGRSADSTRSRLARLAEAARGDMYLDLVSIFPLEHLCRLVPEYRTRRGFFRWVSDHEFWSAEEAMDSDLCSYLPDDLLRKTDTASMAVGLEVRCPFLAPGVAGPALRAPADLLMPRGQRKGLLRAVARKYFPSEIVDRPKQGFAIPIGDWFRSDYGSMKQLLMDHLESAEPWGSPSLGIDLNMKFVRRMLDEHMNHKRDHSQRLYMLLVLSIWAKGLTAHAA